MTGEAKLLGAGTAGGKAIKALISDHPEDLAWDKFLLRTPTGQFQQASAWGCHKAESGWSCSRTVFVTDAGEVAGGFQILSRRSKIGRIGYVSKGPVLGAETEGMGRLAVDWLVAAGKKLRLAALLVQGPDESRLPSAPFAHHRFKPNWAKEIIRATLITPLAGGIAEVDKNMNPSARLEVRKGKRRGCTVREGGEADIAPFFEMMRITCERQQSQPNPATVEEMRSLWRHFQPLGGRLTIAEAKGKSVAGLYSIPFGKKVTAWKKGWNGDHRECFPNRVINHEGMEWACARGYVEWDYAAVDYQIAQDIVNGRELSEEQRQSRHMFNLGFGGVPRLLPDSQIWIRNPLFRFAYEFVYKRRAAAKAAAQQVQKSAPASPDAPKPVPANAAEL